MRTTKFNTRVVGAMLVFLMITPLSAATLEYCTDLSYFGDYGAMSFAVTTDDDADTAVLEIVAGYAKGFKFEGSWDGESGIGTGAVAMSEDPLVGTIGFDFEIVSAGSSTEIEGTVEMDGSGATFFTGVEGACTSVEAPLEGDYCLKVGDKNISMKIIREISGTGRIVGNLASPTGTVRPFSARRDSATGLILEKTTGAEQFKLEFAAGIVTGGYKYKGRTFATYGIRNPTTTATGCLGIMIYSGGTGDFYYATPTIVGHHAYVGTGGGSSHPMATDNYFAKVDLRDMREVWRYDLGTAEVRGSAVLDRKGRVYFVVEEGRDLSFVDGFPEGSHSGSVLKLVKISNPARGVPELEWEYEITAEGETHHMGLLTPAITSRGHVYVGGDALHAVGFDGEELWSPFSPDGAGDLLIYNAPIIEEVDAKLVFFNVNDAGADYSADGIYAVNLISGEELWSYTPDYTAPSTEYSEDDPAPETYSSPQFNLDRTKIYTALRDRIYCFDLSGDAYTTDWEDGCEIPDISGAIRAAPLVDAAGDIYVGTKNNEDSKLYKIVGTCPASPVIWEIDTNADVYTTGVILNTGIIVIGTEPDFDAGILKAYSTTATTGTLEGFFDLDADMTWGSLRMHKGRLIGVANVATSILGGFMFSIDTAGARYEPGAQNPTFRGNNPSTGR